MRKKYPEEVEAYIRNNVKGIPATELARRLERDTGYHMDYKEVMSYKKNHGLTSGIHVGGSRYPFEMLEFVRQNAVGRSNAEMARLVNERFGEGTIDAQHMNAYKKNHGIKSGLTGQFVKGQPSWTKGRPQSEWMSPEGIKSCSRTWFKKGEKPITEKPIGTVSQVDGYLWIKVNETKKLQRERWQQYHRYIWEQNHGPIPEGHNIIFLDGNPLNCDIGNLACVTKEEHIELNRSEMRFADPERTKSGILIAKLTIKERDYEKARRKHVSDQR